jgi:response regulator RpfG family c-di-GMP phosphodiesterase
MTEETTSSEPIIQHILMVDDTPENLYSLEAILEAPGRNLIKANSGPEGLKALLKNDISLVLLDVQMPGMDGFEVAEIMRSNPKTKNVPIVFVTAISKDQKYVFKGYQTGAIDYLFKPLDPVILASKIDFFLSLDMQRRELERKIREAQAHRAAYEREKTIKISAIQIPPPPSGKP